MNTVPSFSARPRQRARSDFDVAEALKARLSLRCSCSDGPLTRLGIEHSSILHYWLRACPTAQMELAKRGFRIQAQQMAQWCFPSLIRPAPDGRCFSPLTGGAVWTRTRASESSRATFFLLVT